MSADWQCTRRLAVASIAGRSPLAGAGRSVKRPGVSAKPEDSGSGAASAHTTACAPVLTAQNLRT